MKLLRTGLCGLCLLSLSGGCFPTAQEEPPGIPIGGLLPFTGDLGGKGANLERAMMLALESINQAGGVAGQPIVLRSTDTHSTVARGIQETEAFLGEQVSILIGPEDADTVLETAGLIASAGRFQVLPGIMAPRIDPVEAGSSIVRWFRLAPTPEVVGCTLGQRILADRKRNIAVMHAGDIYNQSMAAAIINKIHATGQFQVASYSLEDPLAIARMLGTAPDAVALLAFPSTAATVVQDLAIAGVTGIAWYLPPVLRDMDFIKNAIPSFLEGAVGITPFVPTEPKEQFRAAFARRFSGEAPLLEAFYYYDGLVVAALALESAQLAGDTAFSSLDTHLRKVTLSAGETVNWNELDKGLEMLREGKLINYYGVSSSVDLTASGELSQNPQLEFWTIKKGDILLTDQVLRCIQLQ